jgi:hypothetical protein
MNTSKKKASVIMGEQMNTYKGETYENFKGMATIGGKDYLFAVRSDNGCPVMYDPKKPKFDSQKMFFMDIIPMGAAGQRKKRNEI